MTTISVAEWLNELRKIEHAPEGDGWRKCADLAIDMGMSIACVRSMLKAGIASGDIEARGIASRDMVGRMNRSYVYRAKPTAKRKTARK